MQLAVLTGDLIASSALSPERLDHAMDVLRHAAEAVRQWQDASTHFTRQRGDGWQMCLVRPALSLRTALYMRACLRAQGKDLATRISIAEGEGLLGDRDDLNDAKGPVFVASGHGLDAMHGATMFHASGGALGAATRLADHISAGWTPPQAQAMAAMLVPDPPVRRVVAQALGKSRQAVDQALAGAGYAPISDALAMIEAAPS